ncbi:hypothetical protein ACJ7VE_29540 [Streptomyces sp. PB17]|uniref:hypothetical protein n=1 Tax=unclassified Streptomyces TaxID=2593676 RepID=UPI00117FE683|nr:hypothetical protein [Streptomyces sp. CS113]
MATVPAKSPEESRAMKYLAAFGVAPILCFAFQDLGSEYGGLEWLTYGYAAWPMMIGPVLMLLLFFRNRELISVPAKGANFSQTIRIASCLYLIPNLFVAFGYSWLAVISLLSILTILVGDWQIKKRAGV